MARKITFSQRDLLSATESMKRGWKQGKIKAAGLAKDPYLQRLRMTGRGLSDDQVLKSSGPVWLEKPVYQLSHVYHSFVEQEGKAYTPELSRHLERQRNLCFSIARNAHRMPRQELNNRVHAMLRKGGIRV